MHFNTKTLPPLSALGAALLLAACGGGSSSVSNSTVISGKVIDGYIGGATVCLDVNSNMTCDAGEPADTTAADGSYSFEYAGSTAGMHVLAVVPQGATDSELGEIKKPFNLLTPAEKPKTVTPLSTLVSSEMIRSKASVDEAQDAVKATHGLSKDLLDYDFKEANDEDTLAFAQVTATAIASAQEAIQAEESAKDMSTADVIKAAVEQVTQVVLPQVISSDGKVTVDVSDATSQEALEAKINEKVDVKQVVSGRIQQIVARAKAGDGEAVNMADLFKTGFMVVEMDNAYVTNDNNDYLGSDYYYDEALSAEFVQYEAGVDDAKNPFIWQYLLYGDRNDGNVVKWGKRYQWPDTVYQFDGQAWAKGSDDTEIAGFDGNCLELSRVEGSAVRERVCAVRRDLSGKPIKDFIADLCRDDDGGLKSQCDLNATFPAGSFGADLTFTQTQDNYQLWASDTWTGYAPDLDSFIDGMLNEQQTHYMGDVCNTRFQITSATRDAAGAVTSGVMEWAPNRSETGCDQAERNAFVESTSFEVVELGGKRVLKTFTPNIYREQNPGERDPVTFFMQAENARGDVGVFRGDMTPKNTKMTISFTGDPGQNMQVLSKEAFDAILAVEGLPAYPYPQP